MKNIVWVVLDINLKALDDINLMGTYNSFESAKKASYEDIKSKKGKNIKFNNYLYGNSEFTNKSLLGQYGITYDSDCGNYSRCKMMFCQTIITTQGD